jgi:hypothetical protein
MPTKKLSANRASKKSTKQPKGLKAHVSRHFHRYFAGFALLTLVLSFSLFGTTQVGESNAATKQQKQAYFTYKIRALYGECDTRKTPFPGGYRNTFHNYLAGKEWKDYYQICKKIKGSKADLLVSSDGGGVCNGKQVPKAGNRLTSVDYVNFGKARKLKCTVTGSGDYYFELAGKQHMIYKKKGKPVYVYDSMGVGADPNERSFTVDLGTTLKK